MNDHDLEHQLRLLPAPELPADWRGPILATARREARPAPRETLAVLAWLRRLFARDPLFYTALATLWMLILLFKGTTPVDADAARLLAQNGPLPRVIDLNRLSEEIRLAEMLEDTPPNDRPRIP